MAYRGFTRCLRAAGRSIPGINHEFSSKHYCRVASLRPLNSARGLLQLVGNQQPYQAPYTLQFRCASASSSSYTITSADYDDNRDTIAVTWDIRVTTEFPAVWLRDNCQCPQCFHESAIARNIVMNTLDVDIKPAELKVSVCLKNAFVNMVSAVPADDVMFAD